MTPEIIMSIGRQAIEVTIMVAAPLLMVALAIGLVVSIFHVVSNTP